MATWAARRLVEDAHTDAAFELLKLTEALFLRTRVLVRVSLFSSLHEAIQHKVFVAFVTLEFVTVDRTNKTLREYIE